jgi:nitrous oxidase accessory protein
MGSIKPPVKFLIFIIITFLILPCKITFATIHHVGAGKEFHAIQEAINTSQIGDTIIVAPGIYKEKNIIVNKSLVLLGVGYPVLDGEQKYEIVSVKADNVIIKGFKLVHSGTSSLVDIAGIRVYTRKGVTIADNILEGTFFGIYL